MMLGPSGQNILKVLHLLCVYYWAGSCFALMMLWIFGPVPQSGEELFGMRRVHNFIAFAVAGNIGAFGTFFTGVAYSLCTRRGFFRHKWIIMKWAITIALVLIGFFGFAPLNTQMLEHTMKVGLITPDDAVYWGLLRQYRALTVLVMAFFILATVLSVYKPWENSELQRPPKKLKTWRRASR